MSVAFWSVALKSGKPVEVQAPEGYVLNVQQAALDVSEDAKKENYLMVKAETLSVESDPLVSVLGTLRPSGVEQFSVGLVFGYVCFLN